MTTQHNDVRPGEQKPSRPQRRNPHALAAHLEGLGRGVLYYAALNPITGGAKATLFVCQLAYWSDKGRDPGGRIWKTQREWAKELGFSRDEQETVRRQLGSRGIIEEDHHGPRGTIRYRINWERLIELWQLHLASESSAQNEESSQSNHPLQEEGFPQTEDAVYSQTGELGFPHSDSAQDGASPRSHYIDDKSHTEDERPPEDFPREDSLGVPPKRKSLSQTNNRPIFRKGIAAMGDLTRSKEHIATLRRDELATAFARLFGGRNPNPAERKKWEPALRILDEEWIRPSEVRLLLEKWFASGHSFNPTPTAIAQNLTMLQWVSLSEEEDEEEWEEEES